MDEFGNIFSYKSNKVLKPIKHQTGYCVIRLSNNEGTKTLRYHRVVAETLIPNPENLPYVNHKDGNKQNNSPLNLEWCTPKENTEHAITNNLMIRGTGTENISCRFTRDTVKLWLELLGQGRKIKEIAEMYDCNRNSVSRLISIEFPGSLEEYKGSWKNRNLTS